MRKLVNIFFLSLFMLTAAACSFIDDTDNTIVHTVSFYDGSIVIDQRKVADGRNVELLSNMLKGGYVFDGWLLNNKGTPLYGKYKVTSDAAFYAKWAIDTGNLITYSVTFDNYTTLAPLTNPVTVQANASITLPMPSKPGYTFNGWYSGSTRAYSPYMVTDNITLTAHWAENTPETVYYNITFDNFTTLTPPNNPVTAEKNTTITLPVPSKTGYTFNGWYKGVTSVSNLYIVTGNATLTAKWTPNKYTITFDNATGVEQITEDYDTFINLPKPTKQGYELDGWYDGSDKVSDYYRVIDNRTLTARWLKLYTVQFYDGGTLLDYLTQTVPEGRDIELPGEAETGFILDGWLIFNAGEPLTGRYPVNHDINLYAVKVIEIRTPDELDDIRNNLSANYKLITDIDLSPFNWVPIGSSTTPFTGKLNGNGYRIMNLKIDNSTASYVGLFANIDNGTIVNVAIENIDIVGDVDTGNNRFIGAISGQIINGTLANSHSTGRITVCITGSAFGSRIGGIGGIAGRITDSTIIDSYSIVAIFPSKLSGTVYLGGIAGYADNSSVTSSYSLGNVSTLFGYSYAGGVVGYGNNITIANSYSMGNILASGSYYISIRYGNSLTFYSYSGGIAGRADNSSIINSYSKGNTSSYATFESTVSGNSFSSYSYSGGVAGYTYNSSIINSHNMGGNISSTANTTSVSTSDSVSSYSYSGGIAGYADNSSITNSYSSTGSIFSASDSTSDYSYSYAGGIIGYTKTGVIANNYNTKNISTDSNNYSYAGGIVGYYSYQGQVNNCYNKGNIYSAGIDSYSGGIVAYINNYSSTYNTNVAVTNCVALNSVIDAGTATGRIVASFMKNPINTNNFTYIDMHSPNVPLISDGISKTDAELRTEIIYSRSITLGGLGWKFGNDDDNPWKMPVGGGYPILYWQAE